MDQQLSTLEKQVSQTERNMWRMSLYELPIATNLIARIDSLINYLYERTDFFHAPASTRYHSAYPGGLSQHSRFLTKVLMQLTEKGICTWQRRESPLLVGLLHDLTKVKYYTKAADYSDCDPKYIYVEDGVQLSGIHGVDSMLKAQRVIDLTKEEAACIRWHMGAYETDAWTEFDQAIRQFPNVLWTHTADMMASKVLEGGCACAE